MSSPTFEPTGSAVTESSRLVDEELVDMATTARQRAYAPYSGFRMGAAVRTASGTNHQGVLVENVSLGLAMCAERVALFSAVAAGETPVALALAAPRTDGAITYPCGACVQVALELGGPGMVIGAATPDGDLEVATVSELLPRGPHKA
ncbi:MAG: cytidine deaminase [Actinomycetota bacterium]|nr:cytidine deaminase [Actinomycetota bacterium]